MLDTYNQQIQYDVSCTIRTNINTANHHFIIELCDSKEETSTPMSASIGTPQKPSSEENWGGGIARCVKTDESLAVLVPYDEDTESLRTIEEQRQKGQCREEKP